LPAAWKPLGGWLLAGTLTVQFYALALPRAFPLTMPNVSQSEWATSGWLLSESWRGLQAGFGQGAIVLGGLVSAFAGWLSLTRRDPMAAGAMVLPVVLMLPAMVVLHQGFFPRYFFFSSGCALLLAVHGVTVIADALGSQFSARGARAAQIAAGAAIGGVIALSALQLPRCYAPKQDFVGARDYVERLRQPGDAVVAVDLAGAAFHRYFAPQWLVPHTPDELTAIERSHERVWLVYTLPIHFRDRQRELWDLVHRDFEVVRVFPGTVGGGEVTVCRTRMRDQP